MFKCSGFTYIAKIPEEGHTGKILIVTMTLLIVLLTVLAIIVYYRRRISKLKHNEHNVHYMANPDDPQGNLLSQRDPFPFPSRFILIDKEYFFRRPTSLR